MHNNFIIVPSNSLSKDNKIVTNKLSLVLDTVAILNFFFLMNIWFFNWDTHVTCNANYTTYNIHAVIYANYNTSYLRHLQ